MRPLVAAALIALALVPAACNKKPAAPAAAQPPSRPAPPMALRRRATPNSWPTMPRRKALVKTPDGLLYRVIKSGSGETHTTTEDLVTPVSYKGQLINGTVFDQTKDGAPASFPAGHLIPGWVEALSQMKEGDEWELAIPSSLGYGAKAPAASFRPTRHWCSA